MKRTHATAIAVLLGVAGVAGTFAATRSADLGASSAQPKLTERQIVQQSRKLDAFEASLRKSLAERPPALPAVPRYLASSPAPAPATASAPALATAPTTTAASSAAAAAVTPKIIYRRPAPIVRTTPQSGGEREEDEGREDEGHEVEGQGHSESGEGGDDD